VALERTRQQPRIRLERPGSPKRLPDRTRPRHQVERDSATFPDFAKNLKSNASKSFSAATTCARFAESGGKFLSRTKQSRGRDRKVALTNLGHVSAPNHGRKGMDALLPHNVGQQIQTMV